MDENYVRKRFKEKLGFEPYRHQVEAMEALLKGKSIILRAPCGTGKTESAIIPFILQIEENEYALPHHLIYSLPMRVLTESLALRIEEKLHFKNVIAHHGMNVSDPLFENSMIFTTIDQTVGAYCCVPLSSSLRAGNIPAGAVTTAMLCFDEVHTYDYERALQSMKIMLESSKTLGTPFAILSATLPDIFLEHCSKVLGTRIIDVGAVDEEEIPCRRDREVTINKCNGELTHDRIFEIYYSSEKTSKILVVCNTVAKAQSLYEKLKNNLTESCFLLHSRFLSEHRKRRETEIIDAFKKSNKCCFVTTQVCEVGLDISCDILLTEVSPMDSLIQRVGRCARRGGRGEAYVFQVKDAKPYKEELIRKSYKELASLDGEVLRWDMEKSCVNKILGELYGSTLSTHQYGLTLNRLIEASFLRNRRKVEEAVREAFSCRLTIHENPGELELRIFKLPTLSLDLDILRGFYRKFHPKLWYVEIGNADYEGVLSKDLKIIEVKKAQDVIPYGFYVIHPDFARYDEVFGLCLGEHGTGFSPLSSNKAGTSFPPEFKYKKELWIKHAEKVIESLKGLMRQYLVEIEKISKLLSIKRDEFYSVLTLCAAFHDLGKLNKKWQKVAGASFNEPLAHTASAGKLPPHAAISAYSLIDVIYELTKQMGSKELGFACIEAIAHHHSVGAEEVNAYGFIENWEHCLENLIKKCSDIPPIDISLIRPNGYGKLAIKIPSINSPKTYIPYTFISRLLRISDRRSLSEYLVCKQN